MHLHEYLILVLATDIVEGACLKGMLSTLPVRSTVTLLHDAESASALIREKLPPTHSVRAGKMSQDPLACLVVDPRIYRDPAAVGLLSEVLQERNERTSLSIMLTHYSSFLNDPIVRAQIRKIGGTIDLLEINKREEGWPARLCQKVTAYLLGREFLSLFDLLNTYQLETIRYSEAYSVLPSATSGIQLMKHLVRGFWGDDPNQYAKMVAKIIFDISDNGALRFGHTSALRDPDREGEHPEFRTRGVFNVQWWPRKVSTRDQGSVTKREVEHYADLLGDLIEENLIALGTLRELSKAINEDKPFLLWLLNQEDSRGLLQRLWFGTFVDSADDPPTIAFPCARYGESWMTRELLNIAVRHELMHMSNLQDRGQLPLPWIWFDEALANWFAWRVPTYESRHYEIKRSSLDDERNGFAGMAFARFIEKQYGPQSLLDIWRANFNSVFVAAERILGKPIEDLMMEFFIWAFRENVLVEDRIDMDGHTVFNHASYVLFKIDRGAGAIQLSCKCRDWQQHVHLALFEHRHSVPQLMKFSCSEETFELPKPCSYLLIVNAGWRSLPSVFHDDQVRLEFRFSGFIRSAGA